MTETVKLTLRLPATLHRQIKERAAAENYSLNTMLVETLRRGLAEDPEHEETEREKVRRVLREAGLLAPLGPQWFEGLEDIPDISHEELRELLKDVPPLSEIIIEEREPR